MTKPEVVCCRARGEQLEGDIGPDHVKIRNIHNHYLQDREEQKGETFTGMGKHFLIHDSCATESMGAIFDRSKEHLGVSDKAVIAVRKHLLNAVEALENGEEPPHIVREEERNWFPHIDCCAYLLPASVPWRRHFDYLTASAKKENPASFSAKRKAVS